MPKWTAEEDRVLRRFYEMHAGKAIPTAELAHFLERSPGAVRYRAHTLGLADGARPRKPKELVEERACAHCGQPFTPRSPSATQQTCSRSCGAKQRTMANRGRFRAKSGRAKVGKRPDIGPWNFRSAWEANYARYLNHLQAAGKIVRWEYEPEPFHFPVKRGNKGYLPDFKVHLPNGDYEWHEVKGYMDDASRIKLKRFALHYPDESRRLVLIDRPKYQELRAYYSDVIEGWE